MLSKSCERSVSLEDVRIYLHIGVFREKGNLGFTKCVFSEKFEVCQLIFSTVNPYVINRVKSVSC